MRRLRTYEIIDVLRLLRDRARKYCSGPAKKEHSYLYGKIWGLDIALMLLTRNKDLTMELEGAVEEVLSTEHRKPRTLKK